MTRSLAFAAACSLAASLGLAEARAQSHDVGPRTSPLPSRGDGVYGRFDGDLDFGVGAGASHIGSRTALELRSSLHYFSSAGIWFGAGLPLAEELPEPDDGDAAAKSPQATLAFGIDVRPAFLPRFSENLQQGPAWLDLWLDTSSLSLGAYFDVVDADGASPQRGLELSFGSGLALLGEAEGPWLELRAIGRFPEGDGTATFGGVALLSWHEWFGSPLLD